MATVIIMPKQGQSVESCILTELNKKKGDKVDSGEILFSYETDKAAFDEESRTQGTVLEVFYNEGDEIPVLTNVMIIGEVGESIDDLTPASPDANNEETSGTGKNEQSATVIQTIEKRQSISPDIPGTNSPVSPRARILAEKHAIIPEKLAGTGPGGRVIENDVLAAIDALPKTTPLSKEIIRETGTSPTTSGTGLAGTVRGSDLTSTDDSLYGSPSKIEPLSNIRKLIANAMHDSLRNSAQLTHHLGADARNILELRSKAKKAFKKGASFNITINDMVCFSVIRALGAFPGINAHFMGDSIRVFSKVNLGLAVDTKRGLMVPVVRKASDMSIKELSEQLKKVATACKDGNIDPDLLSSEAASITVTNLGNYGVEMFTPVINLPQIAILGVNTILPRPKELGNGVYGFVPHIGLSLTYDHRAIDGAKATRFLKQVATEIETLDFEI